jgi:predicted kinase
MTEPTDDEVLLKAKQLARDDGRLRLWGSEFELPRQARNSLADEVLWAEYLRRARQLLQRGKS